MAENSTYKFSIPEGGLTRKSILTSENRCLIRAMKKAGRELVERRMALGDGGDLSARTGNGFLITAAGADLSDLSDEDFVLVESFDSNSNSLTKACGLKPPSPSTSMHSLIYSRRPDISAIIRAEDAALSRPGVAEKLRLPAAQPGLGASSREAAEAAASLAEKSDVAILPGSCAIILSRTVEEGTERADVLHRRGASTKV